MKRQVIIARLAKYYHPSSGTIVLEVIEGKPHSAEGGVWVEAEVKELEEKTEALEFDKEASGYSKYLDKWHAEGLITSKERDTGKS